MPVGEGTDEIPDRASPVPVALEIIRRLDFGHPIDELQSVWAGGVDRIDHHLAVRQQSRPYHAGAGQYWFPSRHAAPHVDAGIARLALAGEKLLADRGGDAIAGDCETAEHRAAVGETRPAGIMEADTGFVLMDT